MTDDSYALNDDGSAKDPKAFQQALRSDAAKMTALQEEPETLRVVLGDDMHAFQELVKGVYQVRGVWQITIESLSTQSRVLCALAARMLTR